MCVCVCVRRRNLWVDPVTRIPGGGGLGNRVLWLEPLKESDFRGLRGLGLQFGVVFLQKRTQKVPNSLKQVVWRLEEEPVGRPALQVLFPLISSQTP